MRPWGTAGKIADVNEGPETQYAENREGVHLAYQSFGSGSLNLLAPIIHGAA